MYVLEAITPKVCQETYSYERFELLGDAFLKYAVSLFLFHKFPEAHEGTRHTTQMVYTCMKTRLSCVALCSPQQLVTMHLLQCTYQVLFMHAKAERNQNQVRPICSAGHVFVSLNSCTCMSLTAILAKCLLSRLLSTIVVASPGSPNECVHQQGPEQRGLCAACPSTAAFATLLRTHVAA